jgi:hypothetical protein
MLSDQILTLEPPASSTEHLSPPEIERLAPPLTDAERQRSHASLRKLSVLNRFRLMAGGSLLPEPPESTTSR